MRKNNFLSITIVCASLVASAFLTKAADTAPPENPIFPRPTLVPLPASVAGLNKPTLSITNWKSLPNPTGEFWANNLETSTWTAPSGRGGRGGGGGASLTAFRTSIPIPADWSNKRILIRFEGVADSAKLYINGQLIREHWGSLMPWSADITDHVKPGENANITLAVDESRVGLNLYVRGGGIQRESSLFALPQNYLTRLHADTTFDPSFKDATLHLWLTMSFNTANSSKIKLTLKDPAGKEVPLTPDTVELTPDHPDRIFDLPVPNAIKWDAEHPNLYTLEASLLNTNSVPLQTDSRQIGLRQIQLRGNQLFVNGNEVKLRGVWGGNTVAQLKELNANHSRQKWITEQFLNDADRLGLYVLDENPVDFAKYGAESDPQFAYQWLSFISDMLERDRSHPSVITWGLGNESFSGPNILKEFHYAQIEDTQRPATFSWANRVPTDQELPYSIYIDHYPNMADPATNFSDFLVAKWHSESLIKKRNPLPVMPILADEYSHTVQNRPLLERDPNVRSFWGESLKRYWEKMFTTQGALGGDIFGLTGGFGSTNNESFLVRKAYSPIRIANQPLPKPGPNNPLLIPIKNWFDHTNLSEIKIDWSLANEFGSLQGPNLSPHAEGTLSIPPRNWKDNDTIALKFSLPNGTVIDDCTLTLNPPTPKLPTPQGPAPTLETNAAKVTITGQHFKVTFDKYRGLIDNASYDGKTVLIDGPFLNVLGSGLSYPEWWCDHFDAHIEGKEAVINLKGNYAIIQASFQIRIDGQGLITTHYTIDHLPGDPPPSTFSPWDATSMGGYSEVGASYMLPNSAASLTWNRKALYSTYPATHIGRPQGTAPKGSDDFRATKEYILSATLDAGTGASATALSDGSDSVRAFADPGGRSMPAGIRLCINNQWNYPDIGLGNYTKPPILIPDGYSNTIYLQLAPTKP